MRLNVFSKYLNILIADNPRRTQWAKAHRAHVALPTTVPIWVNTRNKKQIWHHHDNSNCNMSIFSVAVVWIIVLGNLWITFVAYSARWHGVSFCYIKTGRSNMWAWIEVILLWRLKGVALNLLRPRGTKIKSLGFYGGGGFANSANKYVLYTWPEYAKTIVSALRDFDELKQSPQMDFAAAVGLCVLCCGWLSLFLLSKFVVFCFCCW